LSVISNRETTNTTLVCPEHDEEQIAAMRCAHTRRRIGLRTLSGSVYDESFT